MDERHPTWAAAKYDRARLLRLGAVAAAPLVLGLQGAGAAITDETINGRGRRLAALEKKGVFSLDQTWGGGYHYLPQRLLTTRAALDAVLPILKRAKVRFEKPNQSPDDPFTAVGAVEIRLASRERTVPDILRNVFGQEPLKRRQVPIAPHYVLFGEPEYDGGPFGPPTPGPDEDPYPLEFPAGGPRIAVIDTGYHWGIHRDLDAHVPVTSASVLPDVTPHDSMLDDEAGHAMFIAGIIVRRVPNAVVEMAPVLNGLGFTTERQIVAALARFDQRPDISVINMSLGGFSNPQFPPIGLARALAKLPPTTAIVASAGNNHTNQPMYPAAFARVIGVAASVEGSDAPAPFSNYGPWVNCYAPGVKVQSAFDNWSGLVPTIPQSNETFKGWATWNGTSFSAPKVSAAIAAKVGPGVTGQQSAYALLSDPSLAWTPDYGWFLDLA